MIAAQERHGPSLCARTGLKPCTHQPRSKIRPIRRLLWRPVNGVSGPTRAQIASGRGEQAETTELAASQTAAVVVPMANESATAEQFLRGLLDQLDHPPQFVVFVVLDNASSDGRRYIREAREIINGPFSRRLRIIESGFKRLARMIVVAQNNRCLSRTDLHRPFDHRPLPGLLYLSINLGNIAICKNMRWK